MKTISLFSLFALLLAAPSSMGEEDLASCGYMSVGFAENPGNCPNQNAIDNNARRVVFDAMMEAVAKFTDFDVDTIKGRANYMSSLNGNDTPGYPEAQGRNLVSEEFLRAVAPAQHRELLTCSGTAHSCTAWWCCMFCGWWCRRRELMEEAVQISGRSLNELNDAICAEVQAILDEGKGVGCLKGATISHCDFIDPTDRKDPETVESTPGDTTTDSSASPSTPQRNMAVTALLGVAAFMA